MTVPLGGEEGWRSVLRAAVEPEGSGEEPRTPGQGCTWRNRTATFCSRDALTVMTEDKKAHISVMKTIYYPMKPVPIVPSEVWLFKILNSVSKKLQDGLKQKTLRSIRQNHHPTEKAEMQGITAALWQPHQKESMSFEKSCMDVNGTS